MLLRAPEHKRADLRRLLSTAFSSESVHKAFEDALVKHFSTAELRAWASFWRTATGQSILEKHPEYLRDLIPTLDREISRTVEALKDEEVL
jgi:hypothetical protein